VPFQSLLLDSRLVFWKNPYALHARFLYAALADGGESLAGWFDDDSLVPLVDWPVGRSRPRDRLARQQGSMLVIEYLEC
jgi:hypothetical protein